MQCETCRKVVPDESIKMVPKQTYEAVCHVCRGEEMVKINPRASHMNVEKMDELPARTMFFCNRCQYKFRHNTSGSVKLYCPWCGDADQTSQLQ
jgi:hypothetical protein